MAPASRPPTCRTSLSAFGEANVTGIAGAGIGLTGVKQTVEQHGGAVAVESVEGAGTTVHVRLPLSSPTNG